jgi:hypothetical protein
MQTQARDPAHLHRTGWQRTTGTSYVDSPVELHSYTTASKSPVVRLVKSRPIPSMKVTTTIHFPNKHNIMYTVLNSVFYFRSKGNKIMSKAI